jgi:hypothetical protein
MLDDNTKKSVQITAEMAKEFYVHLIRGGKGFIQADSAIELTKVYLSALMSAMFGIVKDERNVNMRTFDDIIRNLKKTAEG